MNSKPGKTLSVSKTVHLSIPADINYVPYVRHFIGELCRQSEIKDAIRKRVELAIDESCMNICRHTKKPDNLLFNYNIEIIIKDTDILVNIDFPGKSYPFQHRSKNDIEEQLKGMQSGGLGHYIIQNITDKVEYEHKDKRNFIKMEFNN